MKQKYFRCPRCQRIFRIPSQDRLVTYVSKEEATAMVLAGKVKESSCMGCIAKDLEVKENDLLTARMLANQYEHGLMRDAGSDLWVQRLDKKGRLIKTHHLFAPPKDI